MDLLSEIGELSIAKCLQFFAVERLLSFLELIELS